MKRLVLSVVLVLAVVPAGGAALASFPAPVTLDGVGGVTPGMTPAQVAQRWQVHLRLDRPGESCRSGVVSRRTVHGYALFEGNKLGAVFFDRGARTASGITIGSTAGTLRRAFGSRLTVRPHQYVRGGHYFFLTRKSAPHWRIRFDTNAKGRITQIGFGARAVAYVEGCA